jgi:hypothetical protein
MRQFNPKPKEYADTIMPIPSSTTPNGLRYFDARNVEDDDMIRSLLRGNLPVRFDWENKWLRGDQYAHMLNNIDAYRATFGMPKLGEKQHPENIYVQPESKCRSSNSSRRPGLLCAS